MIGMTLTRVRGRLRIVGWRGAAAAAISGGAAAAMLTTRPGPMTVRLDGALRLDR